MGIPHLKRYLEPYAKRGPVSSCKVAVDGPAFAYFILGLCLRKTSRSPFEQPSYELLGRTAIAWLDRIQECGPFISAIYFDGFLPALKRAERMQRLLKLSQELRNYHQTCPAGVQKERAHFSADAPVDLFPSSSAGDSKGKPPVPPFLVPSIIDALKSSKRYASLTEVVPAEADVFCARHARQHGGVVLTSDSDLLIHDLGPDGSVVFLGDIDVNTESMTVSALQYSISDICQRLSLNPETGMAHLAFELTMDSHLSIEQAVKRSRKEDAVSLYPEDYSDFIEQYLAPESASGVKGTHRLSLDPRISEIALRASGTLELGSADLVGRHTRGVNGLAIYLPFLLDCPLRTSAWESSKRIRQLAYALLQPAQGKALQPVSEFRKLQTASAGIQVELLTSSAIDEEASALLDVLSSIKLGVSNPEMIWLALSIYYDIILTVDQGKSRPLSLDLFRLAALGKLDQLSWDFLHFLAQAQATYYSLRILRQLMAFTSQLHGALSAPMAKLDTLLSELPPLADFPSPRGFADMLKQTKEAGALKCLASICVDYEDIVPQLETPRPKKDKRAKRLRPPQDSTPARKRTNNPFGALAVDE
ncbi:XPG domain containing-domain-containing protein [Podospora appendiculata]|uniref:XPG domain containing-domain-containing protein n=1 Tax=Podospora appendiculata TaxID=314037 RepID=A0AAE0X8B4_9PEZI|nr:XPG domain containing-domain-containing protein [Podospora appendiculata]